MSTTLRGPRSGYAKGGAGYSDVNELNALLVRVSIGLADADIIATRI
jgi:hypothetical protein